MLSAQILSTVLKSSHYVDVVMPRRVATMGTYPQHFIFFKTNEWAQKAIESLSEWPQVSVAMSNLEFQFKIPV
jgi:hypothetical protein